MKKKKKNHHKSIVFGKQPLIVFSEFVTHPVTGFTLEEIGERIDFDFLEALNSLGASRPEGERFKPRKNSFKEKKFAKGGGIGENLEGNFGWESGG